MHALFQRCAVTVLNLHISVFYAECNENIALGKPAFQSSTSSDGERSAAAAVDGDENPIMDAHGAESCTHTVPISTHGGL